VNSHYLFHSPCYKLSGRLLLKPEVDQRLCLHASLLSDGAQLAVQFAVERDHVRSLLNPHRAVHVLHVLFIIRAVMHVPELGCRFKTGELFRQWFSTLLSLTFFSRHTSCSPAGWLREQKSRAPARAPCR